MKYGTVRKGTLKKEKRFILSIKETKIAKFKKGEEK
jgi:hypothetical protein